MISLVKKSLQLELHNFMQIAPSKHKSVSNSAFNQARMKIKPELFKHFVSTLNKQFYTDNDERVILWNGFRLISCDGSYLTLPITKEIIKEYNPFTNQNSTEVVIGRTSVLYDLENNMILDGVLSPYKTGERQLATEQLKSLKNSGYKELVLLDRGYPSFDLIYQLKKWKIGFVIRTKANFSNQINEFAQSSLNDTEMEIKPGKNASLLSKLYSKKDRIKVRVVKLILDNGEQEILITSLLNTTDYPIEIFKDLYFKRWGIETLYDKLKNKLLIEEFTGYSQTTILQDFYCTLFLSNIQSLLVSEANEELKNQGKNNKMYEYKVNTNLSIGFMKTRLVELFLKDSNTENVLNELEKLFLKNLIPIRPNRSFPRNTLRYRKRKKPPITKNFKPAF